MKTNLSILIAVLAITWANVVQGNNYVDSEIDSDELTDPELCDEGPPMDVHYMETDPECGCTISYLITASDHASFRRLFRKLKKLDACEGCNKVTREISDVLFVAAVETTEKCARKLARKGYLVEENSVQQITHSLPSLPVRMQDRIDQVDLPFDGASYDRNDASDVTIFLLDTGVLTTHDEFSVSATVSRAEFFADTTPGTQMTGDVNGHGTRCASVAIGKNIGIAQGATLQSIRVAGTDGTAATDDVIAGLNEVQIWANNNPGSKCVVSYSMISMATSVTLDSAFVNLTVNTDCVVLVAAGNFGNSVSTADSCDYSPARVANVITVGASRFRGGGSSDDRQDNSNYGPCVDIYAPGRNVDLAAPSGMSNSFYLRSTGTSFSTPAVAGAAAMILSTTSLTPTSSSTMTDMVRDILIQTSAKDKLSPNLPAENAPELPSFNRLLNVVDNTFYQ